MRLTLRTLLAYLDKVLEPSDAKALQEKIHHGRLARGMIDRIQSVVARPKLSAPKVEARGVAGDANIVAEYLDNTLSANQVAEFEQACLAEDARLAEVASCHQILSIVLAKPAVVAPSLRNRIRHLGDGGDVSPQPAERKSNSGSDVLDALRTSVVELNEKRFRVDAAHRSSLPIPEEMRLEAPRPIATAGLELDDKLIKQVPEYLKSGTTGNWKNASMILGLLAALLLVAWFSLGSLEEVRALLGPDTNRIIIHAENAASPPVAANEPSSLAIDQAPAGIDQAPPAAAIDAPATPVAPSPSATSTAEPALAPATIVESSSVPPGLPAELPNPPGPPIDAATTAIEATDLNHSDAEPGMAETSKLSPEASESSSVVWQPETNESADAIVLAMQRPANSPSSFRKLANGDGLMPEEVLIVPPAFRTELKFAPGIRWTVADESVLTSSPTQDKNTAGVDLRLGRALVHATPDCQRLSLRTPEQVMMIVLNTPSSILAVELRYTRIVGKAIEPALEKLEDHSIGMMLPTLSLVCVAGGVSIEIPNTDPLKIDVGQGFEWSTKGPARAIEVKEIPWWYRTSVQRPIDGEAAQDLSARLSESSEEISIANLLQAAISSRRSETAALAMRTMFFLGEYAKCLGSDGILAAPSSRPHRNVILESLYQSLGSDVQNLTNLVATIEATDPPRAMRLLGLLSLPDDTQLADGADRNLVEALSSPFLDERVLGIYQLNAVLGKELGYQSDRPNLDSVQQWKRLLNSGKIRWPKSVRER